MTIFTSNLRNDEDMNKALGSMAVPVNLFTDACFSSIDEKLVCVERKKTASIIITYSGGSSLCLDLNIKKRIMAATRKPM